MIPCTAHPSYTVNYFSFSFLAIVIHSQLRIKYETHGHHIICAIPFYTHTTNNINGFSGQNVAIRKLWEKPGFEKEKRNNNNC